MTLLLQIIKFVYEVFEAVRQIDSRSMEVLNYKTAIQAFRDKIIKSHHRSKQS